MKRSKYMPVVLLLATLFLVAMVSGNDDRNLQEISNSMGVEQYAERYGISENEALD
jgi:hypothetical protein